MEKDKLIEKICKGVIGVFGVLAIFNFILLINKKSYALFTKTITSDETVVHIETGDSLPIKPGPAVDIVKDTIGQPGGVIGIKSDNTSTTSSEEAREYRYSGNDNIKNYIYFNCEAGATSEDASSKCEKWRIVGVFKDEDGQEHLKIVRDNVLTRDMFPAEYTIGGTTYKIQYTSSGDYAYRNDKVSGTDNNDWATAGLQYWLNTTQDETEGEPNKGYLSYLKGDSLSMIEETTYYLGSFTPGSSGDDTISSYAHERAVSGCEGEVGPAENSSESAVEGNSSCRVWAGNKATWTGKIALLYPSDYGFTADSSYWSGTTLYDYDSEANETSWLQQTANHSAFEWLLSPSSNHSRNASYWGSGGFVNYTFANDGNRGVRPSLNLTSQAKIVDGDGSSETPYFVTSGQ